MVLSAVAALDETFGFPVFKGYKEIVVNGLQRCQGLEAADGLFWQFGSESDGTCHTASLVENNRRIMISVRWLDQAMGSAK